MQESNQKRAEREFKSIFGSGFIRLTSNWEWRSDRYVLRKQRRDYEIWRNHNEAVVFSKRGSKAHVLPLTAYYKEWREGEGEYVRWRVSIEDIGEINRYKIHLARCDLFAGIDQAAGTEHVLLSRLVAATCGINVHWKKNSPRHMQTEVHHISKCTHDDRLFNLRVMTGKEHDKLHRDELEFHNRLLDSGIIFEPPDIDLRIYEKVDVDSADRWKGDFLTFLHKNVRQFRLDLI